MRNVSNQSTFNSSNAQNFNDNLQILQHTNPLLVLNCTVHPMKCSNKKKRGIVKNNNNEENNSC